MAFVLCIGLVDPPRCKPKVLDSHVGIPTGERVLYNFDRHFRCVVWINLDLAVKMGVAMRTVDRWISVIGSNRGCEQYAEKQATESPIEDVHQRDFKFSG